MKGQPTDARAAVAAGLLLGVAVDQMLGDPRRWHPVAGFGQLAGRLERASWADNRAVGVGYTAACVLPVGLLGVSLQRLARRPVPRSLLVAAGAWVVLGGRSLCREGAIQHRLLTEPDLPAARARLSYLAGRDAAELTESEIARAVVESIAENLSDAVVAPLVWGAALGLPGLLGYRAVNTLDAMVGHRSPRYQRFGWCSARLDDLANLLPARLTALLVAACSGRASQTWRVIRRDAGNHPSPNSGWCEAAFAGALELTLGGVNSYQGRIEHRPRLGDGRPARVSDIPRAVQLASRVTLLAGLVTAAARLAIPRRRSGASR